MKLIFKTLIVIFIVFSCSSNENIEVINSKENNMFNREIGCPPNSTASIHYEFSSFKFKRPKFNCESGFWFCTTDGEWIVECHDNYNGAVVASYSLSDVDNITQRTTVAGIIDYNNKIVDFYFPIELANVGGNKLSDFDVFNVDDDESINILEGVELIPGNYYSRIENTEIIISVDFH